MHLSKGSGPTSRDNTIEVFAWAIFHHQVSQLGFDDNIEAADDIFVIEAGRGLGLANKSFQQRRFAFDLFLGENFDHPDFV